MNTAIQRNSGTIGSGPGGVGTTTRSLTQAIEATDWRATVNGTQSSDFAARFWSKANVGSPEVCWPWQGTVGAKGYGMYSRGLVHRTAYELAVGTIAPGLHIDHLCRNRRCVNPAHMEAVTPQENVLRGVGLAAKNARKTHCMHGHEFTPENTYEYSNWRGIRRVCRECVRARGRAARVNNRRNHV